MKHAQTPEQRAETLYPEGTIDHALSRARVAKEIRRAENAAIKRCAERADQLAHNKLFDRAYTYERIIELRTRAPSARARKRT